MKKFFTFFAAALISASIFAQNPEWLRPGDEWDEATKTLTVNSNPAQSAYISQSEIEHLIIGNAVTNIGVSAFEYCTNLTSVSFGNQLSNIEQYAFMSCGALTSVELPNSLTKIEGGAFIYCGALASVTIGTGITKIEAFAFKDCGSLTSLTCQAINPPTLDNRTFNGCNYLSQIYVPAESVDTYKAATNWSAYASFFKALQPAWVQPGDSWDEDTKTLTVNSNPGGLAYYDNQEIEHLIISNGVTNIGNGAFQSCEHISSVVIPNSVTGIENYAFYYCEDLLSVVIPGSVNRIGESAFENCVGLTSVTIEEGVTVIGFAAFGYCVALTSVYIPNTIIRIENDAFHQCYALTHIDIPNSVTNIGNYSFFSCTSLTDLVIPSNVESIGSKAFFNCSALISMTIGTGVTSIGESAFLRCSALTSVTCEAVTPPTAEFGIFDECAELAHIYVPAESVEVYKTATNWSVYEAIIEAIRPSWLREGDEWDEATKTLTVNSNPGVGAYQEITEIEHVIVSEGVTSIAREAFYYCSALTTIELPASIESIGDYAFQGCPAIVSVTCKALNPPTMGDGIFYDSSALEHIYVPAWSVEAYKAATEWSLNAAIIELIPGTEAIDHTIVNTHATKCIENGQLIILRDGQRFNATGAQVK